MDEAEIARVLERWAAVDKTHRESLLQCCLSVFGRGDCSAALGDAFDALAAADGAAGSEGPPAVGRVSAARQRS